MIAVTLPQLDPDGSATGTVNTARPAYRYTYDANGNQTSVTDPNNHTTRFTYDEHNRQLTRTLPLGVQITGDPSDYVESMQYDAVHGQLIRHVDFEGRVTEYEYDNTASGGGRLIEKRYRESEFSPVAELVTYTYDALGREATVTQDRDGDLGTTADQDVTSYTYDPVTGGVASVTNAQGVIHYEYDEATVRLERTYTDNTETRYTYDQFGRLKTVGVYERNNTLLPTPEVTTYGYDLVGNLDWVHHDWNGVVADYQYDALNRLELLEHFVDEDCDKQFDALDEELRARFAYEVGLDGARKMVTETDDQGRQTVVSYTYDGLNRLVKEERDHYDDTLDAVTTYVLDLVGNRVELVLDRAAPGSNDERTVYAYDANDRLTQETLDSDGDTIVDQTTVYSYSVTEQTEKAVWQGTDTSVGTGTLLSKATYEYNLQGRMLSVLLDTNGDGTTDQTLEYRYDDSGIRISQSVTQGGTITVTTYLIDASNHTGYAQVLEEYVDGVLTRTYTLGHDVVAQQSPTQASGDTLSFLYDGHGSTRALLDALGAIVERYAYDAFGNILTGVGLTTASVALTTHLYAGE